MTRLDGQIRRELSRRLQDADPAADEPGLSGDELDRLRRALAEAARGRPRISIASWSRLRPLAATLVAALLLVLAPRPSVNHQTPPPADVREPVTLSHPGGLPAPAARDATTSGGGIEPKPEPVEERLPMPPPERRSPHPLRPEGAPIAAPAADREASPVAAANPRQLRFRAPGGTQIIWVLTSGPET